MAVAVEEDGDGIGRIRRAPRGLCSGHRRAGPSSPYERLVERFPVAGPRLPAPQDGDRRRSEADEKALPAGSSHGCPLKRRLPGTHQGAAGKRRSDYYLDGFTFRFNRRTSRSRDRLFHRLLQQAVVTAPAPESALIARSRARSPARKWIQRVARISTTTIYSRTRGQLLTTIYSGMWRELHSPARETCQVPGPTGAIVLPAEMICRYEGPHPSPHGAGALVGKTHRHATAAAMPNGIPPRQLGRRFPRQLAGRRREWLRPAAPRGRRCGRGSPWSGAGRLRARPRGVTRMRPVIRGSFRRQGRRNGRIIRGLRPPREQPPARDRPQPRKLWPQSSP